MQTQSNPQTYHELSKEIDVLAAKYGSKNRAYASEEYRKLEPLLAAAYKSEGLDVKRREYMKRKKQYNKEMKAANMAFLTGLPVDYFLK